MKNTDITWLPYCLVLMKHTCSYWLYSYSDKINTKIMLFFII